MVAIILVNYNGYEDTIQCMESFCGVDNGQYTIYVVDNGSSNDSYEIINNYCEHVTDRKIKLIRSSENLGFSGGNNIGICKALDDGA